MLRFVLAVGLVVSIANVASAQLLLTFNIASLGLGNDVIVIALESDEAGVSKAILHRRDTNSFFLVNPRKGPTGLYPNAPMCIEPIFAFAASTPQNPHARWLTTTATVNWRTVIQVVDLDASDGNAPLAIIDTRFQSCR